MIRLSPFHSHSFNLLKVLITSASVLLLILCIGLGDSLGQSNTIQLEVQASSNIENTDNLEPQVLDFRYSPLVWQTCIGLPADPHKTVVGSNGGLYYDFKKPSGPSQPRRFEGFHTSVIASMVGETAYTPIHQRLLNARVPVVITEKKMGALLLHEEAWSRAPEKKKIKEWAPRRVDYLWLKMKNSGSKTKSGQIVLKINTEDTLVWHQNKLVVKGNPGEVMLSVDPANVSVKRGKGSVRLIFPKQKLAPGDEYQALVTLYPGKFGHPFNRDKQMYKQYRTYHETALKLHNTAPTRVEKAAEEKKRTVTYWKNLSLPYDKIHVPDHSVQRLLDSSIRNIYQAMEYKDGYPVLQVGPTYYRGSWAADGPFLMEAMAFLGKWKIARFALEQQVDSDTGPGGIKFSKKSGLRLWMIWRHAQLTGDWKWLKKMWPDVKTNVNHIKKYRRMSYKDSSPLNDGLMPKGYGDGGLGGIHYDYTNVYWTLSGLKAAIQMAKQLDKSVLPDWKSEYKDFWKTFNKTSHRDALKGPYGNVFIPPTMRGGGDAQLPQRGAWAFMLSVYPGKIFPMDDSLMLRTMHMLDDHTKEGLILGTGWLAHGIWNYAGGFYANAHLWLGDGAKAASTLYAFGNHASPLLTWREEQYPVGYQRGQKYQGDMPHNWASAEFIISIRNLMILERGDTLDLLEGMPKAWTRPGDTIKLSDVPTSFGNISLTVSMAEDGQSAKIKVVPPQRNSPKRIMLHLEHFNKPVWSVTANGEHLAPGGTVQISAGQPETIKVKFKHRVEERYVHPKQ